MHSVSINSAHPCREASPIVSASLLGSFPSSLQLKEPHAHTRTHAHTHTHTHTTYKYACVQQMLVWTTTGTTSPSPSRAALILSSRSALPPCTQLRTIPITPQPLLPVAAPAAAVGAMHSAAKERSGAHMRQWAHVSARLCVRLTAAGSIMLGMTTAVRSMATRVMLMQGRCFVMVFVLLRYACVSDTERQTHTDTHRHTQTHTDTHTCVCGICFRQLGILEQQRRVA